MLAIVGLAPHPPLIIPDIGRSELNDVQNTVNGMRKLGKIFNGARPEVIVIISPHGQVMRDRPAVLAEKKLVGDFGQFGFPGIRVEMETDMQLVKLLGEEAESGPLQPTFLKENNLRFSSGRLLDHGALVPLYYMQEAGVQVPGIHISFSFSSFGDLYQFGHDLRRAIDRRGLRGAVLASGDLSHRLIPGAPAGYSPKGAQYDRLIADLIRERKVEDLLNIDPELVEEAGECGIRSFIIGLGTLKGEDFHPEIISYEGPFGVGYLIAALYPEGKSQSDDASKKKRNRDNFENSTHDVVSPPHLARQVLERYFKEGRLPRMAESLAPEYENKRGVFVTLKKQGSLRGCIGTIEPVRRNMAEEIAANAVSAAVRDPRFSPVTPDELPEINISVDVLSPMEQVESEADLDPKHYGILVRSGSRSGLLLPDLEGIDTVEEQLDIARRKAGINTGEPVDIYRFEVTRYPED